MVIRRVGLLELERALCHVRRGCGGVSANRLSGHKDFLRDINYFSVGTRRNPNIYVSESKKEEFTPPAVCEAGRSRGRVL